jgi:hypothetical protein
LRGPAAEPGVVFSDQGLAVAAIETAIEQVFDPLWIDLQRPHFLPEAIAAQAIRSHQLSIHELLAEEQDQSLLRSGGAAEGGGGHQ